VASPTIPDYELLRPIGGGAYGEVWLARSKATGALRAAKIVWRHTFEDDRPFSREFEGIQRFEKISREHPSQLALFHIGRNDEAGYFYCLMELADNANAEGGATNSKPMLSRRSDRGEVGSSHLETIGAVDYSPHTLRAELAHGRLSAARTLEIAQALAEALSHLHRHGLVHRDVKPSNVIFVNGRPKLADIGLVTDASDQCSIVGTEGYLPPEGTGTPQADIFALGKVLYETATGMDRRRFPELPKDLREWPERSEVIEFNEIVLKACAKDLAQRYQSADEMRGELALLQSGKSVKRRRALGQRCKRARNMAVGTAVLAVTTLMVVREFKRARFPRESNPSIGLGRIDEGPPSTNDLANDLYARAMLLMRADDSEKLGEAYTNFVQTTRLDPNFANAHAALFEMHFRENFSGMPPTTHEGLQELTKKLVELAPTLAATHVAVSCMQFFDWKYAEAKKSCEEAIRVNPHYEFAHTHYGWILILMGDLEEGRKQLWEAANLERSKAVVRNLVGCVYYAKRDYTHAIEQFRRSLISKPYSDYGHGWIGRALRAMGKYQEAIDEFETQDIQDGGDPAKIKASFDELRRAFEEGGERGYWLKMLERTATKPDSEFYWKAVVQIHLGHTNEAFGWLTKAYETREKAGEMFHQMDFLLFDEYWDGLHEDPQFKALLRKVGYPNR
jgi:serine/threonine protein kinase/Tfp pilus assembly protein PilF